MKKAWMTVVPLLLALLILMAILLYTAVSNPFSNRVFEDISAFEKLNSLSVKGLPIDAKAAELKPKEEYCKEIRWEDNTYSVYAYVFADAAQAKSYFTHVTGKESALPGNFSSSGNCFFNTRYIAYYENRLYLVKGGSYQAVVRFVNWLNADFPLDLEHALKNSEAER